MTRPARARFRRSSPARAWGTVALGIVLGLLAAEGLVRLFSPDWRYVAKSVFWLTGETAAFEVDPDPRVRYRLKPGISETRRRRVTIDSLGFRGPERSAAKPPGVFRILTVGGSNVFGLNVADEQTWPLRLEQRLNRDRPGRYEVWNAAACGYVTSQSVVAAQRAVDRFDIDLVILALSNVNDLPFLSGQPIRPFFEKDPTLWREVIAPPLLAFPAWLPDRARLDLVAHVRSWRTALLAGTAIGARLGRFQRHYAYGEDPDVVRRFVERNGGRVRTCVFVCPGCMETLGAVRAFYRGLDVPVLELHADDYPTTYRWLHPPPEVMVWYADKLAPWLAAEGLLEPLPATGKAARCRGLADPLDRAAAVVTFLDVGEEGRWRRSSIARSAGRRTG